MKRALVVLFVLGVLLGSIATASAQSSCKFVLGFENLRALIPAQVGTCAEDEWHNSCNGDGIQKTTGGMMVWRKADNWTAFTDGGNTWINGPCGLQKRLNTQRFPWEPEIGQPVNCTAAPVPLPADYKEPPMCGPGGAAPATAAAPASSPAAAAGRVLFTSNRESYDDIFIGNIDGSGVRRLTTFGYSYGARFSPDSSKVVFEHDSDLWVMNADGTGLKNITNTDDKGEYMPDWSPDGSKIVYSFLWLASKSAAMEIYVCNADGSGAHPLIAGAAEAEPRWSPDGSKIVFTSLIGAQHSSNWSIYVINADGTGVKRLTNDRQNHGSPVWSPDGKEIAFSALNVDNKGEAWRIWRMNADGSNQRMVMKEINNDPGNSVDIAAWVGSNFLISGYQGNWDVFMVNADGGPLVPVIQHPKDDKPTDWH